LGFLKSTGERYLMPQLVKEIPSFHATFDSFHGGLLNVSHWRKNEEIDELF